MDIDTTNKFLVAVNGTDIVFLRPVPQRISADDALLLAAYLVALAESSATQTFDAVLTAVEST